MSIFPRATAFGRSRSLGSFLLQRRMSLQRTPNPLIAIIGSTGTGKSALAIELAARFNGEVVNADALQLYKGLPIITNKIPETERREIPHHLIDELALDDDPWTVTDFVEHASAKIKEIRSRGKVPIVVGGTHYYIQSLLFEESLVSAPKEHDPHHESPEQFEILEQSTDVILQRLREVDPLMADRWHPKDRRKIKRSLEIYLTTGVKASAVYSEQQNIQPVRSHEQKFSGQGAEGQDDDIPQSILIFWTYCEKEALDQRLDQRVDTMISSGLLNEVEDIDGSLQSDQGALRQSEMERGISIAIGYKEFGDWRKAKLSPSHNPDTVLSHQSEAIDQVKAHTRQYAKYQNRWIRRKFLSVVDRSGLTNNLFLLDATDLGSWEANVSTKAATITEMLLRNSQLPEPSSLSPTSAKVLRQDDNIYDLGRSRDKWFRQECLLCNMTAVTEHDWEQHLRSRNHRRQEKKSARSPNKPVVGEKEDELDILSDSFSSNQPQSV